jgi:hypothetical protein
MESAEPLKVSGAFVLVRTDFGVGAPHRAVNPMSVENEVQVSFELALPPQT